MSDRSNALQQRFEHEFDHDRFREQLNWLIENRLVLKNGRLVKRTNKSIVQQIKLQHPRFDISETHFGNLVSGKRQVIVSLQLAAYICQIFGVENLDFFLDPDMERQRQMMLEPVETLQNRIAIYAAMEKQAEAVGDGAMLALRGFPQHDLATLEQLITLRAHADEVDLLAHLRLLPVEQRAAFEQLIRGRSGQGDRDASTPKQNETQDRG